ncbi:MAG: hypothetical protein ACYTJ0_19700, partial [Planctomycetota bacterium]
MRRRRGRSSPRGARRRAAVAALLAAAGGCAAPEAALESGYVMLEPSPGTAPALGENVYPLRAADWRYQPAEGGDVVVRRRRPTEQYRAAWSDEEETRRTHFWRHDDEGNLVVTAVIDHGDQALTIFDPPIVTAYAALAPGERREMTSQMRVVDVRNPRRQKEAGTATQGVHYVGDQELRTPMGRFTAQRLEVEFTADMRLADAHKRQTLYVVPEL